MSVQKTVLSTILTVFRNYGVKVSFYTTLQSPYLLYVE